MLSGPVFFYALIELEDCEVDDCCVLFNYLINIDSHYITVHQVTPQMTDIYWDVWSLVFHKGPFWLIWGRRDLQGMLVLLVSFFSFFDLHVSVG